MYISASQQSTQSSSHKKEHAHLRPTPKNLTYTNKSNLHQKRTRTQGIEIIIKS